MGKQKRTTRSTENAEQGLNNVQAKLNDARGKVRQSTKNYIIGGGISDALEDITNGNFGELGDEIFEALDDFIGGIDNGRLALETKDTDKKNATCIARLREIRQLRQLRKEQKQVVDKLLVYLIYLLLKKAPTEAITSASSCPTSNDNFAEETIALMKFV